MDRRDFLLAGAGLALSGMVAPTLALSKDTEAMTETAAEVPINTHRFGVTYTPTKAWFHHWNDFDSSSIAHDLDDIVKIGADHIRVMVIWPYFQPNRLWVSPVHLERLDQLMRLASQRHLDVQLCMLNGFVSAIRFFPYFLLGKPGKDFYAAKEVVESQEKYFREIAKVANRHSNFLGFDLANEIPNAWSTGHDTDTGDKWCENLFKLSESLSPGKVHVNGAWGHWFFKDTFSAEYMARRSRSAIMHCYGQYADAPGGLLDPGYIQLPAATAALIRAYAGDPSKPVWCQEFGVSDAWAPAKDIVTFLEKTTLAGIKGGVNWFTWWSSHDLNPKMEFESHEYQFGLITNDRKIKPQGHLFKEFAGAYRGKPVVMPVALEHHKIPPTNYDDTWKWMLRWIRDFA